jgi:RNA polymerase sigma factor (sigma-70 family)
MINKAKDSQERSPTAKDNIGIARQVALRFLRLRGNLSSVEDTEEFADACVGLVNAEKGYDPSSGYQFSTFAYICARREVVKGIKNRTKNKYTSIEEEVPAKETNGNLDEPDKKQVVGEFLNELTGRSLDILKKRHLKGMTLEEIGNEYGISKERVRQIIESALKKIRENSLLIKKYEDAWHG